jgi:hypothetical protein
MRATRQQKMKRKSSPSLEHLDARIAPAGMGAAVALAAEIRVETHAVHRWDVALSAAQQGSARANLLTGKIAGTEARIGTQEVRLARIEARSLSSERATSSNAHGGRIYYPPQPTPGQPSPFAATASSTNPQGGRIYYPPQPTPGQPSPFTATASDPPPLAPATATGTTTSTTGTSSGTSSGASGNTSTQPLPGNVSVALDVIYSAYEQDPSGFPAGIPATDGANRVIVQGDNVGIQVQDGNPADFAALVSNLQSAGMQIQTSSAAYGIVVGMLSISQLPTVAQLSDAPSVTALMQSTLN